MILYDDETLTRVNDNIELIQKKDGLTFGTDAYLLSAYMREGRSSTAVDFGCGTGIISLLCAARGKFGKIYAVDVQEEFCDVARRNCEHNGFENIEVIHSDVRELKLEADVVFTNPPYMKARQRTSPVTRSAEISVTFWLLPAVYCGSADSSTRYTVPTGL